MKGSILFDKTVEFVVAIYDNVRVTNHYEKEENNNILSHISWIILIKEYNMQLQKINGLIIY